MLEAVIKFLISGILVTVVLSGKSFYKKEVIWLLGTAGTFMTMVFGGFWLALAFALGLTVL